MAEALLGAPNGGAFAVWASSGYTTFDDQKALGDNFVRGYLQEGLTLGDAARQAKGTVGDPDVRRSWILFGDPSQSIHQTIKRQGGLHTLTPGTAMGCSATHRPTSPAGLVLLAAAALLLRRRQSGSLAKRANPAVRSVPPV